MFSCGVPRRGALIGDTGPGSSPKEGGSNRGGKGAGGEEQEPFTGGGKQHRRDSRWSASKPIRGRYMGPRDGCL